MGQFNKKIIDVLKPKAGLQNEFMTQLKKAETLCGGAKRSPLGASSGYIEALEKLTHVSQLAYINPTSIKIEQDSFKTITSLLARIREYFLNKTTIITSLSAENIKKLALITHTIVESEEKCDAPRALAKFLSDTTYIIANEIYVSSVYNDNKNVLTEELDSLVEHVRDTIDTFFEEISSGTSVKELTRNKALSAHGFIEAVEHMIEPIQYLKNTFTSPLLAENPSLMPEELDDIVANKLRTLLSDINFDLTVTANATKTHSDRQRAYEFAKLINDDELLKFSAIALADSALQNKDTDLLLELWPYIAQTVDRSTFPLVMPLALSEDDIIAAIDSFNEYWTPAQLMQEIETKVCTEKHSGYVHTMLFDTPLIDGYFYIPTGKEPQHGLTAHKISQLLDKIFPSVKGAATLFLLSTEYKDGRPLQIDITSIVTQPGAWGLALRMQSHESTFKISLNNVTKKAEKIERCASILFNKDREAVSIYSYEHKIVLPLKNIFPLGIELNAESLRYFETKNIFYKTPIKDLYMTPHDISHYKLIQKLQNDRSISQPHKDVIETALNSTQNIASVITTERDRSAENDTLVRFKKDPKGFIFPIPEFTKLTQSTPYQYCVAREDLPDSIRNNTLLMQALFIDPQSPRVLILKGTASTALARCEKLFTTSADKSLLYNTIRTEARNVIEYPTIQEKVRDYLDNRSDITPVLKAIQEIIDVIIDTDDTEFLKTFGFKDIEMATENDPQGEFSPIYDDPKHVIYGKTLVLMNFFASLAKSKGIKYLPFSSYAMQCLAVKSRRIIDSLTPQNYMDLITQSKVNLIRQIVLLSNILNLEDPGINAELFPLIYTGTETRFFSLDDLYTTHKDLNTLITKELFPGYIEFERQGLSAFRDGTGEIPADVLDRIFKTQIIDSLSQVDAQFSIFTALSETGTGLFTKELLEAVHDSDGYILLSKVYALLNTVLFTLLTQDRNVLSASLTRNRGPLAPVLIKLIRQVMKYGQLLRTPEFNEIANVEHGLETADAFYTFLLERYRTALENNDRDDTVLWAGLVELNRFSLAPFNNILFDEDNVEFMKAFKNKYTEALFVNAEGASALIGQILSELLTLGIPIPA